MHTCNVHMQMLASIACCSPASELPSKLLVSSESLSAARTTLQAAAAASTYGVPLVPEASRASAGDWRGRGLTVWQAKDAGRRAAFKKPRKTEVGRGKEKRVSSCAMGRNASRGLKCQGLAGRLAAGGGIQWGGGAGSWECPLPLPSHKLAGIEGTWVILEYCRAGGGRPGLVQQRPRLCGVHFASAGSSREVHLLDHIRMCLFNS